MFIHFVIGAVIAGLMFNYGIAVGIYASLALALLWNIVVFNRKPPPVKTIELLEPQQVHKHAENVIGTYLDSPIHEYVEIKNPANGNIQRYHYFDIIHFNHLGQILFAPKEDEIFLSTRMIYKIQPSEPK